MARPNGRTRRRIKDILYDRDGDCCFWCEEVLDKFNPPTTDRLIPGSCGGTYELHNLVLSCARCNNNRKSMPAGKFKKIAIEYREEALELFS